MRLILIRWVTFIIAILCTYGINVPLVARFGHLHLLMSPVCLQKYSNFCHWPCLFYSSFFFIVFDHYDQLTSPLYICVCNRQVWDLNPGQDKSVQSFLLHLRPPGQNSARVNTPTVCCRLEDVTTRERTDPHILYLRLIYCRQTATATYAVICRG